MGDIAATFEANPSPTGQASVGFAVSGGNILVVPNNASATGDVVFTFSSPRSVIGRVRVSFRGNTNLPMAQLSVDIGNNSSTEFSRNSLQGNIEQFFDATVVPPGLEVRVSGSAFANLITIGGYSGAANVTLEFIPRSTMVPYGPKCDHALTGSYTNTTATDTFGFRVANAPTSTTGLLVLGTFQVSIPIPPSNCLLLAEPAVLLPIVIGQNGSSYIEFTIGRGPALTIFTQTAVPSLQGTQVHWKTSNGLDVQVN